MRGAPTMRELQVHGHLLLPSSPLPSKFAIRKTGETLPAGSRRRGVRPRQCRPVSGSRHDCFNSHAPLLLRADVERKREEELNAAPRRFISNARKPVNRPGDVFLKCKCARSARGSRRIFDEKRARSHYTLTESRHETRRIGYLNYETKRFSKNT